MRANLAQRLIHHLRQISVSTGLPLDYVRKSPRKNAPHILGPAAPDHGLAERAEAAPEGSVPTAAARYQPIPPLAVRTFSPS